VDALADAKDVAVRMAELQRRRVLARLAERGHHPNAVPLLRPAEPAVEVLDALEAADQAGTPASVTTVAALLDVDQPRASRLVARAIQAGLVRREADQADGRRGRLVRTAAGERVSAEVHAFRSRVVAAAMADWSETERLTFARLLTRFVDALGRTASSSG
jgi:DNA-binding MarR family transcriptional regulator